MQPIERLETDPFERGIGDLAEPLEKGLGHFLYSPVPPLKA